MRQSRLKGTQFAGLAMLVLMTGCAAGTADVSGPASTVEAPAFIAPDFDPPVLVETADFKLVPLSPELTEIDYQAYMSSIDHLQRTFTRSTNWPHDGLTLDDALVDMQTEQRRFAARESFAYAVLTPDGSREIGSVYVQPSPVAGYDAVVRMWVTRSDFDRGFDPELYSWVQGWIASDWPFENVVYPGRSTSWEEWDALVSK